jgi:long-subunit fatty acid transport protein
MRRDAVGVFAVVCMIAAIATAACPRPLHASFLQLPHIGGRDGGMSGNVVASPTDGPSVLLFNPAGVVGQPGTQVTVSLATSTMSGRYTNPQTGYDQKSSEMPFGPLLWIGSDHFAPWYVGAGLYGSVGSSFNFAAEPSAGVPEQFLAESGLVQLGLVIGREIVPGLRFGVEGGPNWGRIRTRTPSPLGAVNFDVDGFGLSGATGLLYDLTAQTTFGMSYRSPGVVYMGGDGRVGAQPEHVDINFHTPQSVIFGIGQRFTPKLLVTAQATWTDYPDFENGVFRFEHNPVLNSRFINRARSTVRYGVGLEYEMADWLWLRSGVSREEWMIDASAVSPLLYDTSDFMVMLGLGIAYGNWLIDANVGYGYMEDRLVTSADQRAFPGRYELDSSPGITVALTYRLGPE